MGIKIIIPSRGRHDNVLTNINNAIICVDVNELDLYKKHNDCEIITHDSLSNLSKIRQFIYKKFGDVFMVDDDLVSCERLYTTSNQELTPKETEKIINEAYYISKQIGSYLFGFNNDPSPTHYNQHKPFMLNGYINGSSFGVIKSEKLYFSEKTTACESHWINLLNAYYNRYCFIDKRFHFRQLKDSTFSLNGGQTGKRTLQSEKFDTLFLRKTFGESVILKKEKNKTNQLHQYQRQLNIKL